jgi:hypothetical protein
MWLYGGAERYVPCFLGKHEGKRSLGKPKSRWENNIKVGLHPKEIGWVWSGLMWLRIGTTGSYEHCNEHTGSIICGDFE